jgi:hypothetical protein
VNRQMDNIINKYMTNGQATIQSNPYLVKEDKKDSKL